MKRLLVKSKRTFIHVDEWIPEEDDLLFKHAKGVFIAPVSRVFGCEDNSVMGFDYFILSPKRCYSNLKLREHFARYLNYFEKFYDTDKELLSIYAQIKYLIDFEKGYTKEALAYDLDRYILSGSFMAKIDAMNLANYRLDLDYSKVNSCLEYNNKHGKIMMKISLIMIMIIPILTHFIYVNRITDTDLFLLEFFDKLLHMFDVDIYSKLYETALSKIERNMLRNPIWNNQDIRGLNQTTHVINTVNTLILNVMPKYDYTGTIIFLNLSAIENNSKFQVTDIGYEYEYIPLSNSNVDEDNNSEFDKFESYLTKQDESLYLQNKVNCQETMKYLEQMYGPFDMNEIEFYKKELMVDGEFVINSFQMELVFNLFYKYFGDPVSIKSINSEDYIKLILIAKKMLQSQGMIILPYIISGKIVRLISRKNVNKKELLKLEASPYYTVIMNKYKNDKIETYILSLIATIISSEFQIIDYQNKDDEHGKHIARISELICDELLMYINLI